MLTLDAAYVRAALPRRDPDNSSICHSSAFMPSASSTSEKE